MAFLFFFRADFTDSPDCLPILLSIPVFYFVVFLFFHFLVLGSVRYIKLTHASFDCTLKYHLVSRVWVVSETIFALHVNIQEDREHDGRTVSQNGLENLAAVS